MAISLTFYGGVGEIGANKILVEAHNNRIFLDCGTSFSREDEYFEFPLLRPSCKRQVWHKIPPREINRGLEPGKEDLRHEENTTINRDKTKD
ncbi:hypothetical protein ES703_47077 [subsurface metagenome]